MSPIATLAITFPAGAYQGAQIRQLSKALQRLVTNIPDSVPGQTVVLTLDNAPSSGTCSVAITGGAYATGPILV